MDTARRYTFGATIYEADLEAFRSFDEANAHAQRMAKRTGLAPTVAEKQYDSTYGNDSWITLRTWVNGKEV